MKNNFKTFIATWEIQIIWNKENVSYCFTSFVVVVITFPSSHSTYVNETNTKQIDTHPHVHISSNTNCNTEMDCNGNVAHAHVHALT